MRPSVSLRFKRDGEMSTATQYIGEDAYEYDPVQCAMQSHLVMPSPLMTKEGTPMIEEPHRSKPVNNKPGTRRWHHGAPPSQDSSE